MVSAERAELVWGAEGKPVVRILRNDALAWAIADIRAIKGDPAYTERCVAKVIDNFHKKHGDEQKPA